MDAKAIISGLLKHVHEWHWEDRSREINFCESCGATYPIGVQSKEHKPDCQLKKLLQDAESFVKS